jgi:hypothetical protein
MKLTQVSTTNSEDVDAGAYLSLTAVMRRDSVLLDDAYGNRIATIDLEEDDAAKIADAVSKGTKKFQEKIGSNVAPTEVIVFFSLQNDGRVVCTARLWYQHLLDWREDHCMAADVDVQIPIELEVIR